MLPFLLALTAAAGSEAPPATAGSARATTAAEIVVTGTRVPASPLGTPRAVAAVDPDEHAPTAHDLTEVIDDLPGVHMQRTNRGAGSPFLRGLVGPQNLVLVDGLAHNLSTFRTGPNQYLNLLEPFGDRVEVLRGPSSVLYGTGAMGGVIQLRPTPVGHGVRIDARGRTATADASFGGDLRADVGGERSWARLGVAAVERGTLRTGTGRIAPLSDFARQAWLARAGTELDGGHHLSLSTRGVRIDGAGRADAMAEGELRRYDNTDSVTALGYRLQGRRYSLVLTGGLHHWSETQHRTACATDGDRLADREGCLSGEAATGLSERRDQVNAGLLSAQGTAYVGPLAVVAGAEGQLERVGSTRRDRDPGEDWVARDRGNFSDGSRYATGGVYAHGELDAISTDVGTLKLRAGARLAHFAARAEGVPLPTDPDGVIDDTYLGVIGSGGVSWVGPHLHLWTGVYQGFRAPNLEESTIFGPEESRFSVPNPDLKPERSDTAELGARVRTREVQGALVVWGSRIDNALDDAPTTWEGETTSSDGLAYTHRTNVEGARYLGVEAQLGASFGWVEPAAHLSWTRGTVDIGDEPTPARRVPPVFGSARLTVRPPGLPFSAGVRVDGAGAQTRLHPGDESDLRICAVAPEVSTTYADRDEPCPGTAGWATLGLYTDIQLAPTLSARLAMHNVTDTAYRTHGSGIDAPGIDVRAALHASWERR